MLLRVFITVLIIISITGCDSEYERDISIDMIPFSRSKTGKWGYINSKGEVVIDTIFTGRPGFFREGFALIKNEDATFDYIDRSGRASTSHFKDAALFSEGLACVVRINHYPEFIDRNFNTVFRLNFATEAGAFSEGLAKFQDSSGRWGFIDKSGKIAIKPAYQYVMSFSGGMALVAVNTRDGIAAGYINREGVIAIPLSRKYVNLRPFSDGLAAFKTSEGWGYMNNLGATAIKPNPKWVEAADFRENFASVRIGDKWGVIDKQGFLIIEQKYDFPVVFYNGMAAVSITGSAGFIDKNEKYIIEPHFDDVAIPFIAGNAFVLSEGRYIPVDNAGNLLSDNGFRRLNPNYSEIMDYEKTVKSDYFDFIGYSEKILTKIDTVSVNGLYRRALPDSLMTYYCAAGFEIDSGKGIFTAERYKNYNYEILSRNQVSIACPNTDTAALIYFRSVNTLGGNGKGKQEYLIKALLMKLMNSGFSYLPDSTRYIFYSDSSAVLLYSNYNDIILDYYFNRHKHLDSNYKVIK